MLDRCFASPRDARTTFHCMSMRLVADSAVSGRLTAATMLCATMFRNHLPAACAAW